VSRFDSVLCLVLVLVWLMALVLHRFNTLGIPNNTLYPKGFLYWLTMRCIIATLLLALVCDRLALLGIPQRQIRILAQVTPRITHLPTYLIFG
jgi:hypothetical protein